MTEKRTSSEGSTTTTSSPLAGPIQKLPQPTTSYKHGDTITLTATEQQITTCLRSTETEDAGWSLAMKQFMDSPWEIPAPDLL
jgi:hypothetical protein